MPIAFEFQKILLFLEIIICPQPSREKGKPEEISEFSHNKTAYYTIILFSDSCIPLSPLIFFFFFCFLSSCTLLIFSYNFLSTRLYFNYFRTGNVITIFTVPSECIKILANGRFLLWNLMKCKRFSKV